MHLYPFHHRPFHKWNIHNALVSVDRDARQNSALDQMKTFGRDLSQKKKNGTELRLAAHDCDNNKDGNSDDNDDDSHDLDFMKIQ